MPYHVDLKPLGTDSPCGWPLTRAVGWLAAGHQFATGTIPTEALERLRLLHSALTGSGRTLVPAISAGLQDCDFCPAEGRRHAENMELRVQALDGALFLAPAMIGHYIDAHGYCPPAVFVEAILSVERPADLIDDQVAWAAGVIARHDRPALRLL